MTDFTRLAGYTMRQDCHLEPVALSAEWERKKCSTCLTTFQTKPGQKHVCPVRLLIDYQRRREEALR